MFTVGFIVGLIVFIGSVISFVINNEPNAHTNTELISLFTMCGSGGFTIGLLFGFPSEKEE